VVYRVRRGDTLSKIARQFEVSVTDIRRWNKLPHDRIIAGESLEIYPPSP
jgi:membrane-bound lytic murein transglycosylase D